jgi:hypothetical protein
MTNKTINLTPGETLSLNGNQLHGDTVTLTDNNVDDLLTETVNVSGTVALSDMHINTGSLHFVGGTLNFSGTSWLSGNAFRGVAAVFDSNLTGNGTLDLDGGNHDGSNTVVDGSVGAGLTFAVNPGDNPSTVSLQIDDPSAFRGLIALQGGFEYIAFMGLHATSADISNDMLQMFNGNRLVDSVRVTGGQDLQMEQTTAGVMLSSGGVDTAQPGGPGTAIPLHISSVV